jgi:hypothetical protein
LVRADLIANELVAIARPAEGIARATVQLAPVQADRFSSLRRFELGLRSLPSRNYHVLGTAVIGALVAGVLGEKCIGFVDESPFRIGKTFLGRPVRAPETVIGETVVLGLAESLARQLAVRLAAIGLNIVNPWEGDGILT